MAFQEEDNEPIVVQESDLDKSEPVILDVQDEEE